MVKAGERMYQELVSPSIFTVSHECGAMSPMKVCVLASSSSANCTFIDSGNTRILIDAGLSYKQCRVRLEEIGVDADSIEAVCVTHEHSDHVAGLPTFSRKTGARLFANSGTVDGLRRNPKCDGLSWQVFTTGSPFTVGDLRIEPFTVPHDAYDPVGFIIDNGQVRVGVVTDMGTSTTVIRDRLSSCQMAVVESNYDVEMLKDSPRPWPLKQRIMGRQGHLSNDAAGELLEEIANPDLRHIYLAHLSSDCNKPELALKTASRSLKKIGAEHIEVRMTWRDKASDVWTL
jgi:phosphoribosyl 1,2-cyclic phosphodiesterase